MILAGCTVVPGTQPVSAQEAPGAQTAPFAVDHRFSPPWWQTAICLPDDWQKTLVGKEGALLYDWNVAPQTVHRFQTAIALELDGTSEGTKQELVSARIPIVCTANRYGALEAVEEAFAVTPNSGMAEAARPALWVERRGSDGALANWAKPTAVCCPVFRDVLVAYHQPLEFRIHLPAGDAEAAKRPLTVVFGLCEGWHKEAGQRILNLTAEGKTLKTVDMVAEKGQNVPAVFAFEVRDENNDGCIDLSLTAAPGSKDDNTILNALWVFTGAAPAAENVLNGSASPSAAAFVHVGAAQGPARQDMLLLRVRNTRAVEATAKPRVVIESGAPVAWDEAAGRVNIGHNTVVTATLKAQAFETKGRKHVLALEPVTVPAGGEICLAALVARNHSGPLRPLEAAQAQAIRQKAQEYWEKLDLPYGVISVPDAGAQAQLEAAIRNIYQAREMKNGLPAFQVGPTCYRGLWVVDGSFLMEAVALLGRTDEARAGIKYLLSFQKPDGGFELIGGHFKETGIVLWAVTRHARLTNDTQWLADVWPKLERGFAYIQGMRQRAATDPNAPNYRLIAAGFSDGGLAGPHLEYTNVYWNLVGMKAAVDAARWLGKTEQAEQWQKEYDDFMATFRKAAERDMVSDAHGNRCLPISMKWDKKAPVQKAQWGFMHAVFPGKLFAPGDPLVAGNMAMLRAVESQDLVLDTGWLGQGIWSYFGSFYGHAWLWLGDRDKAVRTYYAFANHASPLLVWREEQMPVGKGTGEVGDMPHNWASAEFIRLTRHLLLLERGAELHVFEGLPAEWAKPGMVTRVTKAPTDFGPVSLELRVAADGAKAHLAFESGKENPPRKIVVHLAGWSAQPGTLELPAGEKVEREVPLAGK